MLCSILNCYFILLKISFTTQTTTWGHIFYQKAYRCHRGSARIKTPILSENRNSSVSALEAQMEYFQPWLTSIHTSFTQQERRNAQLPLRLLKKSRQVSSSKQLLVRRLSRKHWMPSFLHSDLMTGLFTPNSRRFALTLSVSKVFEQ